MKTTTICKSVVVLALLTLFLTSGVIAKTVQVGTCLPNQQTYSTVSLAVSNVPPDSTVLVCPGNYPEQVTITQPLTLRGVQAGNAANPTITVPPGGLTRTVVTSGGLIYYQLLAQGTGSESVNISNIGIDGSNNRVPTGSAIVGVYYRNASGKVNETAIYDQLGSGGGVGMVLEGTHASTITITVLGNSIHDFDGVGGVLVFGNVVASIRANDVVTSSSFSGSAAPNGIGFVGAGAGGTVADNRVISHPQPPGISAGAGIEVESNVAIINNTVEGFTIGIWPLGDSNKVTSNRVSQVGFGIPIHGSNNDVEHNHLFNMVEGIGLNCSSSGNIVIHNVINNVYFGIVEPHGTDTFAPNTFSNVANILSPPC